MAAFTLLCQSGGQSLRFIPTIGGSGDCFFLCSIRAAGGLSSIARRNIKNFVIEIIISCIILCVTCVELSCLFLSVQAFRLLDSWLTAVGHGTGGRER